MISLTRPEKPACLSDESVERWTRSLCDRRRRYYHTLADYEAGLQNVRPKRPKASSDHYGQQEVRDALQGGMAPKCHFCEKPLEKAQVEHFRPVARYPALAYRWKNLLLACRACNETHKSDRFPLSPHGRTLSEDRRNPCRRTAHGEAPFLLNPFDDPIETHLTFQGAYVVVRNHSEKGQCTRQVCHLNRKELVRQRKWLLGFVLNFLGDLTRARETADAALHDKAVSYLRKMCAADSLFAGMVRAELERAGMDWREF